MPARQTLVLGSSFRVFLCTWRLLSLSSGLIKPETGVCEFCLSMMFTLMLSKGGQSSSWRSFEELLTSGGVVWLLLCDSSGSRAWGREGSGGACISCLASERARGSGERGLMSVCFYFPLNFTHCWVSLLTDCLWWCWRSTNTAEEAVHATLLHFTMQDHHLFNKLVPSPFSCTRVCLCVICLLQGGVWCTYRVGLWASPSDWVQATFYFIYLFPCVSKEERACTHTLRRLLAPPCPHVCSSCKSILLHALVSKRPKLSRVFERRFKRKSCCVHPNRIKIDGVSLGCWKKKEA